MFRLLKKLTSRLVRVFGTLLPLVLAAPAMAQWGAVTSQPDTNRFINSQQDFGLIMPHQQVIVGLLDTTISSVGIRGGNASKVIVGSLLDHEDNCANYSIINGVASCAGSYEKWRELEKSTSYYQAARGDTTAMFPTNYAITVSTGKDSVKIWNRDTAETWMALREAASVILGDGAINDIAFKDMILYVATETQIYLVDFAADRAHRYGAGGLALYPSNIQEREGVDYGSPVSSTPAITNDAVNTVAAVRDPFGLKDALGRPKHWWSAGTDADNNTFNPHTDTIYRWGWGPDDIDHNAIDDRGFIVTAFLDGSINRVVGRDSEFIRSAVDLGSGSNHWASDNTGDGDIAWAADVRGTDIVIAEPVSWAQNRPRIIYSSAAGVYNLYSSNPASSGPRNQARQRFSATVNAPVEFGNTVATYALEDNTTDSSPYGSTLSVNGSPTNVAGVWGLAYSSASGSGLYRSNDSDFAGFGDTDATMMGWLKSSSATNPSAGEYFAVVDNGGSNPQFLTYFNTDGTVHSYYHNGSAADDIGAGGPDIYDGLWHHVANVRNVSAGTQTIYIDGVAVATDASLVAAGNGSQNDLGLGQSGGSGSKYNGLLDDWIFSKSAISAEAIAKVYAEGRKKLNMGTPVFTSAPDDALLSNAVIAIDALDNGIWAVAFSDANTVQVYDGRIPIQQIAAPSGTVKDIALIQNAGSDSVGVAIVTTTNLKIVQPSVSLEKMASSQLYHSKPILITSPVVVDSAGVDGIFWTGDDGHDAAANAGITNLFFLDGTYGPWDADNGNMSIECSHPKNALSGTGVLFDGGGSDNAFEVVSGAGIVQISNCGFNTTTGGAGGGFNAVVDAGPGNFWFHHNIIIDSDGEALEIKGAQSLIHDNRITGADLNGIYGNETGDLARINDNWVSGVVGNSIIISTNNENVICVGNLTEQAIANNSGTGNCVSTYNYDF